MNKLFLVLMLLGVTTLEAKPKYRIQTWVYNGTRYYLPEHKVWKSGSYPFQHKSQAEDIIENWKNERQAKMDYKRSEFIEVN